MKHVLIPESPFTPDNWEASDDAIAKANEAFRIACETWFDGVNPDDERKIEQMARTLIDRVGNAFDEGLKAVEIAHWATSK